MNSKSKLFVAVQQCKQRLEILFVVSYNSRVGFHVGCIGETKEEKIPIGDVSLKIMEKFMKNMNKNTKMTYIHGYLLYITTRCKINYIMCSYQTYNWDLIKNL